MTITLALIINSVLLGVGLAMDAFSVSLANGLNEHNMGTGRMLAVAGTFAGFQCIMPLIGWFCVHKVAEAFDAFQKFIPWIALALLLYIGGKILIEGIHDSRELKAQSSSEASSELHAIERVTLAGLMLQGIATSIDALSVGFTIANYNTGEAVVASLIIGVVTYIICMIGLKLGKTFGTRLAGKASILGGVILILIGFEIWFTGVVL